jgi:uncharacterized protein YndB with AHSA1/START domain
MVWTLHGVRIADPEQVVVESEPYRRLSFTWHDFTPELARAVGADEDVFAVADAEPRSRVTFEIEPAGDAVKLTVIHDQLLPEGTTARLVSRGWPQVLSKLKTLLETGETFRIP